MLKRPLLTLVVAALLVAGFLYGVMQLFTLGYRTGHVYPPYSSLRADPLGTKVLHEALGDLAGVSVRRNFRPLPRLDAPEPITLLYAGVARRSIWGEKELTFFESRVSSGSRAIFAFFPAEKSPQDERDRQKQEEMKKNRERAGTEKAVDEKTNGKGEKKKQKDDEDSGLTFDEVAKRWEVAFDYLPAPQDKAFKRKAVPATGVGGAKELTWHSGLYFKDLGPEWVTLYTSEEKPVVIERKFGAGSIVLAGDSFFLSNEALRAERQPALLGHLFSGPPRIIFDEEHLGVSEQPGIANLAGKYRLHGAIATLALIAALFVWMNAVPFLPPREDPAASGVVTGKESAEGFVNLLRRTIRPAELLNVCVEEWRKTSTLSPRDRACVEEAWAAEQTRPAKERNPVAAYRTLSQTITRKT